MNEHEQSGRLSPFSAGATNHTDAENTGVQRDITVVPNCTWIILRSDPTGLPRNSACLIDGLRLEVYRHIAYPGRWVAYAARYLPDVVLDAADLDHAQGEAIMRLHAQQRGGNQP